MRTRGSEPSDRHRTGNNDSRCRGRALAGALLLASLAATPAAAQLPSGNEAEDIVRAAYGKVLASASGLDRSFQISVVRFEHHAAAEFDVLPRSGFVTLPLDRFIEGTFSYAGGELSWAPAWRLVENPPPESGSGEDTIETLLQLAGANDPGWLDAVGVTRYTVTLTLQGIQRAYNAAAYWFPSSGTSDYDVRFVDWVLQDLTTIVTWDTSGIVTTPPPEPAANDQCVPETFGPFLKSFQADDSQRTRPERDHDLLFFDGYHEVEANASASCSCKEDCFQECKPVIQNLTCRHVGYSRGHAWKFHVGGSSPGIHTIDDFVDGAGCKVAIKCAFRGCPVEACGFSVRAQVSVIGIISFALTPNDTIIWESPDLSWQLNCPDCTRLFNVGGDVHGLEPDASLDLIFDGASVDAELEITHDGGFQFPEPFPEGETYLIKKREHCTSCDIDNASGTLEHNINDIDVVCQATGCSRVGFELSFETSEGEPTNDTGQVVVRLAYGDSTGGSEGGEETMNVSQPGTYVFDAQINQGTAWVVDPQGLPPVVACTTVNGEDEAGSSGIQYADITCTVASDSYSVTVSISPTLNHTAFAALRVGSSGPPVGLHVLDPGENNYTFDPLLPDGTLYSVGVTSTENWFCATVTDVINGDDAVASVACTSNPNLPNPPPPDFSLHIPPLPIPPYPPPRMLIPPGQPPAGPTCQTVWEQEEIPCPPNSPTPPPCFATVITVVCNDAGNQVVAPVLTVSLPPAGSGPITGIDSALPLNASAEHLHGVLGFAIKIDNQWFASYPAAGTPQTFALPVSSIGTSQLADGEHSVGIFAVGDDPLGTMSVGASYDFIVDHPGGGGGGGSDTEPPQVSIDQPDNGATLSPGTVVVRAQASDDSGISKVEFFRNGVNQGVRHTDTSYPYEWHWQAAPGNHALDVKAYDASPNQNSAFATRHYVNVQEAPCGDPTPPSVDLTAPATNSTHATGSVIRLSADATDSVGVTKVEFFVDSVKVGTDTTAPYWFDWTSSGTGPRVITAKAYDACNSTVSAPRTITLVANPCSNPPPPPTVSLTAPANGSSHTTGVPLTISATASQGVTKVEFYRNISQNPIGTDTSAPYSVSWTPGGTGSVTLTAKAYDGCSTTTSAGRAITLVSNPCAGDTTGPTVAVTWPESGSLPASEAWEMRASATDPGEVDLVEFFVNGSSAGTDHDSPWKVGWSPQPGSYSVKARAVDGCGNEKVSPTVEVTLTSGPTPD